MRCARILIARVVGVMVLAAVPVPAVFPVAVGAGAAAIVVTVEAAHPQTASADNLWLHSCSFYGNDDVGTGLWSIQYAYSDTGNWTNDDRCASPGVNGGFGLSTIGGVWGTHWEQWGISSPSGIEIDSAWTPPCYWENNCQFPGWHGTLIECDLGSFGYSAWYVWGGGVGQKQIANNDGGNCYSGGLADGTPINQSIPATNFFGLQLRCDKPNTELCGGTDNPPGVALTGIQLGATETRAPSIGPASASPSLLFNHNGGWLRGGGSGGGGFDVGMAGWDPSGLCDMGATLNGQWLQGPTNSIDQSVWDQCDATGASQQWAGPAIDTTQYPDGTALHLAYQADNAAGNWATSSTSTSYVDNSSVTLSLGGPTDWPVTRGAAYVTATSSVNPSGDTIWCQTDGGTWRSSAGTSARIPVTGLGEHHVSCYSQDSAQDDNGHPAQSPTESLSVKIGEPVNVHTSLAKVKRTCHWVRVHTKHQHTKRVLRCRATRKELRAKRVPYGRGATVNGWVATAAGDVLGHVPVTVIAAPDNRLYHWRKVAVVTTDQRGNWHARLRPGPSRLIEAVYGGGPVTQRATSSLARLLVPARIDVTIGPRAVPWRGSISVRGWLRGGYVPHDGVALRLLIRYPGSRQPTDLLAFRTSPAGTFRIRFTFGGGHGVVTYPLWVATTASESDYPFAPSSSRTTWITFGR